MLIIAICKFAGFTPNFIKVNHDGRFLKLSAGFSVSLSMSQDVYHQIDAIESKSEVLAESYCCCILIER
jgi:hypothetical protein